MECFVEAREWVTIVESERVQACAPHNVGAKAAPSQVASYSAMRLALGKRSARHGLAGQQPAVRRRQPWLPVVGASVWRPVIARLTLLRPVAVVRVMNRRPGIGYQPQQGAHSLAASTKGMVASHRRPVGGQPWYGRCRSSGRLGAAGNRGLVRGGQ